MNIITTFNGHKNVVFPILLIIDIHYFLQLTFGYQKFNFYFFLFIFLLLPILLRLSLESNYDKVIFRKQGIIVQGFFNREQKHYNYKDVKFLVEYIPNTNNQSKSLKINVGGKILRFTTSNLRDFEEVYETLKLNSSKFVEKEKFIRNIYFIVFIGLISFFLRIVFSYLKSEQIITIFDFIKIYVAKFYKIIFSVNSLF